MEQIDPEKQESKRVLDHMNIFTQNVFIYTKSAV